MSPSPSGAARPDPGAIVVLCAVPPEFDAEAFAAALVEQSLAACVQIGLGVTSIYKWKGAMEKTPERLLLIKTRADLFGQVEAARHQNGEVIQAKPATRRYGSYGIDGLVLPGFNAGEVSVTWMRAS